VLPFAWPLTDALYYLPHFAGPRERLLGTRDPQPPERLRAAIEAAREGILLFHPFLLDGDERFAVLRDALERVKKSGDECAPCRDYRDSS
jgi:hypothetical protein